MGQDCIAAPGLVSAGRRFGLGSVQFGLDYGITNRTGRPIASEIEAICGVAGEAGIDTLDTAHLYGGAEDVIGETKAANAFRIVTKTPKFAEASSDAEAVAALTDAFQLSLLRLRRSKVDALLFHDAEDLLGPRGDALWAAAQALKAQGRLSRLGVSVYSGSQIDALLGRYPIEIVQLPFNALDRRLVEGGQLDRLAQAGVETHARSLFLQGLLLQEPDDIEPRFGRLRAAVAEFRAHCASAGLTPLEGGVSLALAERRIDRFIVGVATLSDLWGIISAIEKAQTQPEMRFVGSIALDARHLNPARWPELI